MNLEQRRQARRVDIELDSLRPNAPHTRTPRPVTLSSPNGDSDATTAAVDNRGRVAVVFTEWRDHKETLRIATHADGRWRVVTLDRQSAAIWSPHVVITPGGTTVVTWIDGTDPTRTVRVAVLTHRGIWQRPVTLENGNGFGNVVLSADRGDRVVAAWHVAVATEWRVRVAMYQRGAWSPVVTLAQSRHARPHRNRGARRNDRTLARDRPSPRARRARRSASTAGRLARGQPLDRRRSRFRSSCGRLTPGLSRTCRCRRADCVPDLVVPDCYTTQSIPGLSRGSRRSCRDGSGRGGGDHRRLRSSKPKEQLPVVFDPPE